MKQWPTKVFHILAAVSIVLAGTGQVRAQTQPAANPELTPVTASSAGSPVRSMADMPRVTQADREAAAQRKAALLERSIVPQAAPTMNPGGQPDYFGTTPNFANSPLPAVDALTGHVSGGIRKFVDALPGLTAAGANNLGQYIPLAVADTTSYPATATAPAADYYEIGLVQYTEKMHTDLQPTLLRGYVQIETPANAGVSQHIALTNVLTDGTTVPVVDALGQPVFAVDNPHYLGPIIVAQRDRPVRVKFTNFLPTGSGGDLFLPVDKSIMGSGEGDKDTAGQTCDRDVAACAEYTQNRATLHLHGGNTPWISDGTQHQWTTPANETTPYPTGVSTQYVPDMPNPGPGAMTFYYTNQQTARLLFYHDHAYGITRLNVYAGEAAGYLLQDPAEQSLVAGGVIPADQIPLVIQDKTFLPDVTQLAAQDPTWPFPLNASRSDFWLPHVYMPNQNPYDVSGANAMGRWDYGPWFWPPFTGIQNGAVANPYFDPLNAPWEPPTVPGTPNPSIVPEAFMDTPIVNGTAYPYVELEPKAYRFRILNAANDRFLNLSLFQADPTIPTADGDYRSTEVRMVPATPDPAIPFPADWTTASGGAGIRPDILDGRVSGVPDPRLMGPSWVQIGTEGGFLPAPAVIPPSPVGFEYNGRNVVVLNVTKHALFLGPAERADVVVDFSQFAGKTLILYNDSPAPVPAADPRLDYYTGGPDFTSTGGAPSTLAGYGPNTRTIMQIRIKAPAAGAALQTVALTNGGADYTTPVVTIDAPAGVGGTQATATAAGSVDLLSVTNPGSGYTAATVTIAPPADPAGTQATAQAVIVNNQVVRYVLTNPGSGYTAAPAVTVSGDGTGAAAATSLRLTGLTLTYAGSGYTSIPGVLITDAGFTGSGAMATADLASGVAAFDQAALDAGLPAAYGASQKLPLVPDALYNTAFNANFPADPYARIQDHTLTVNNGSVMTLTLTSGGAGYTSAPAVSFTGGGGGQGAAAVANFVAPFLSSLTLTNRGAGYASAPAVTITGNGTGATATAQISATVASIAMTNNGTGYTSAPSVSFTGGGGTGAAATAVLAAAGSVKSVTVTNTGSNYSTTLVCRPSVNFSGGGGTGAAATANIGNGGRITSITVTTGGSGYTSNPSVTITRPNGCPGSGATAAATVGRPVVSVTVTNGGRAYTSAPAVNFSGGNGTGAAASATLRGYIQSLTLTNAGAGYSTASVAFTGGAGTGAAATANIGGGNLASLTLTNGGLGYMSAPTVVFTGGGGTGAAATAQISAPVLMTLQPKAIVEDFDPEYGRMNAMLGVEVPLTGPQVQTTIPYFDIDPPTEVFKNSDVMAPIGTLADGTQIWKITHNGVDTHAIHWHMFDVQIVNRVGWDGAIRPPEPNEVGWKDTVRMNPLEDIIVALRPITPQVPFDLPNSVRALDVTRPLGSAGMFHNVGPDNEPAPVLNQLINFGWEYVWHCHLLGHEENIMMRSIIIGVAPRAPSNVTAAARNQNRDVLVTWHDNSANETGFIVERAVAALGNWTVVAALPANTTSFLNAGFSGPNGQTYVYRVTAQNVVGYTEVYAPPSAGYPNTTVESAPALSNLVTARFNAPLNAALLSTGFEAGLGGWAGLVGNVQVNAQAAMAGGQGLAANVGGIVVAAAAGPQGAYVYDTGLSGETAYTAAFAFNPNGAQSGDTPVDIFVGLDQNGQPAFGIQYESDADHASLTGWVMQGGVKTFTDSLDVTAGPHSLQVSWESGPAGVFFLTVDGQSVELLSGDTSSEQLSEVILGPSQGVNASTAGTMYFDQFASVRVSSTQRIYLPQVTR